MYEIKQQLDPLHYALNLVGEESAEIGQQSAKSLRFGLLGPVPRTGKTNLQTLQDEITDLVATLRVLNLELVKRGLPTISISDEPNIQRKVEKIAAFAQYSIDEGILTEPLTIMI